MKTNRTAAGFTLIELLIYMLIIGMLLSAVAFFFTTSIEARTKNQTISEVNTQGAAIMDAITQTIRNATSINTPAAGQGDTALSLVVPTGSLSPTLFDLSGGVLLGYDGDGGITDSADSNSINATKIVASGTGTISVLYAYVSNPISASPNNLGQMALYSGTSAAPTALLAKSASVPLNGFAWNAFSIPTVNVTSGQTYWIAYNTNGAAPGDNDLRYRAGAAGQSGFLSGTTFGTWPNSWTPSTQGVEFSMYAPIEVATNPSIITIKEGSGSAVNLNSGDVHVNGLTFKNLTRSGTAGLVQVSFTVSRVNPLGRNEYDYRKTFTTTVEIGW